MESISSIQVAKLKLSQPSIVLGIVLFYHLGLLIALLSRVYINLLGRGWIGRLPHLDALLARITQSLVNLFVFFIDLMVIVMSTAGSHLNIVQVLCNCHTII